MLLFPTIWTFQSEKLFFFFLFFFTSKPHLPEVEEWKSRTDALVLTLQPFNSNDVPG